MNIIGNQKNETTFFNTLQILYLGKDFSKILHSERAFIAKCYKGFFCKKIEALLTHFMTTTTPYWHPSKSFLYFSRESRTALRREQNQHPKVDFDKEIIMRSFSSASIAVAALGNFLGLWRKTSNKKIDQKWLPIVLCYLCLPYSQYYQVRT